MAQRKDKLRGWRQRASTPFSFWRRLSMRRLHWPPSPRIPMPSVPRHNYTLCVFCDLPFGDVGPIAFLLSFIKMRIIIDDVFFEEGFPQFAGFLLLRGVASLELEIIVLVEISSDLCGHSLCDISINYQLSINIKWGKKSIFTRKRGSCRPSPEWRKAQFTRSSSR